MIKGLFEMVKNVVSEMLEIILLLLLTLYIFCISVIHVFLYLHVFIENSLISRIYYYNVSSYFGIRSIPAAFIIVLYM